MRADGALRVLMLLESDFKPQGGGGAESQVRTLARRLRRDGQRVTILTPLLPWGPQVTAERCAGLPVGRVAYPRWRLIGGIVMALRVAAFLWRKRTRYDAWHVHIAHHLAVVACLVGPIVGKPVIVKVSGIWELEHGLLASRGPVARLLRAVLGRATAFQAISGRIAKQLAGHGFPASKIVVLPNAVDTARFHLREATRAPGAPFTGVFVGRLVSEKGLGTLLDAWARAFRDRPGVARLRLVGGGPLHGELRAQAEHLGIASQVELLGPSDRVEQHLAVADAGLLTSRVEGLSNTLLEFMATGLPVIATRVSGSEDFVVSGRNGWLVDVGDVDALAAALRDAASLPPERLAQLGRNAREDVTAAAALDNVVGRLMALYRGR
jgi:glycosyltransferase involved in cell wall biosynthesis